MFKEKALRGYSGWLLVLILVVIAVAALYLVVGAAKNEQPVAIVVWAGVLVVDSFCFAGLTVVNPNEARVVLLFGKYKGSLKEAGFWWVNPLTTRRRVSLRVRNFESSKLKVNDHDGNPVEIAAVVVWKVIETAEAMFNVDDYEQFVHVQSEAAVRNLATSYPYDAHEAGQLSLRMSAGEINERLKHEIHERLSQAGIDVIEARISHLAYAPEIANAMLRRQQASAVIAARQKIVEGAVGMVEMALEDLSRKQVLVLDEERKAAMVSNLLVVLCSEQNAQPVVNAGTLYQ
ncbi:MAG: SPFH domain-containing protein [Bryobacterales bacterium]|nr:SPFH domain-containing protein [Bryobacterales bacterium]